MDLAAGSKRASAALGSSCYGPLYGVSRSVTLLFRARDDAAQQQLTLPRPRTMLWPMRGERRSSSITRAFLPLPRRQRYVPKPKLFGPKPRPTPGPRSSAREEKKAAKTRAREEAALQKAQGRKYSTAFHSSKLSCGLGGCAARHWHA